MADRRPQTTNQGLDSEVEGFAICGDDRKWVWANASIKGGDIIVSAAGVSQRVAVRYAWASNPDL